MRNPDKTIEKLRVFFSISNAAFGFVTHVMTVIGKSPVPSQMEQLHQMAYQEVIKEKPDIDKVLKLIDEMEKLAEKNSLEK